MGSKYGRTQVKKENPNAGINTKKDFVLGKVNYLRAIDLKAKSGYNLGCMC